MNTLRYWWDFFKYNVLLIDPAIHGDGCGRALPPIDEAHPNRMRTWSPEPGFLEADE
jgi:hypothetical protein